MKCNGKTSLVEPGCRCCHLEWGVRRRIFSWVEEDCCSNRSSDWQYWGGCSGDTEQGRVCHHGTAGFDTLPGEGASCQGSLLWKQLKATLRVQEKGAPPPHAPSGNNSPANQGGLWEQKQAVTLPVVAATSQEQIQQRRCSGKEFLVSGWRINIVLKIWTHSHPRSCSTDSHH